MEITLAETAGMGGPEHWLRAGQRRGPAGADRSCLLGYGTFSWGSLRSSRFSLGGQGRHVYGLIQLSPFGHGGSCSLSLQPRLGLMPHSLIIQGSGNFNKPHSSPPFSTFIYPNESRKRLAFNHFLVTDKYSYAPLRARTTQICRATQARPTARQQRKSHQRCAPRTRALTPHPPDGQPSIANDSKGNIYTTETYEGKRLQKFAYKGMAEVQRT